MATLPQIRRLLRSHNISVLDIPWKLLKPGQLVKILRWEISRDKDHPNG